MTKIPIQLRGRKLAHDLICSGLLLKSRTYMDCMEMSIRYNLVLLTYIGLINGLLFYGRLNMLLGYMSHSKRKCHLSFSKYYRLRIFL